MHKTVIKPGMWGEIDAEVEEPQMSYGVVTDRGDHRHVRFSGGIHPEGSLAEQVRTVLGHRRDALTDLGGSMADVTTARYYVLADRLDRETQGRIHEVRAEFYDRPHYPASTMVGVASLLGDALVEIELEAEIPEGDWTVARMADHRDE